MSGDANKPEHSHACMTTRLLSGDPNCPACGGHCLNPETCNPDKGARGCICRCADCKANPLPESAPTDGHAVMVTGIEGEALIAHNAWGGEWGEKVASPEVNAILSRELPPAKSLASAVEAFKLAMQAGDESSAAMHATQMLPFLEAPTFKRLLEAARALDKADRATGPGSDEAHAEAECAIWDAAIEWSRSETTS
jgi:hypothetical protein